MNEVWKRIPNYEDFYMVSDIGNVRSLDRIDSIGRSRKGRILKPANVRGQLKVVLCVKSKTKMIAVSQLVAMAFLGHKRCGYDILVDHIDNNPQNNNLDNLQLLTQRENLSKDKKGTSKYAGVSWNKKLDKWVSQIHINGEKIWLGSYHCELSARDAYQIKLMTL